MKVKFFNSQCLYNKYTDLIDTVLSEDLDIVAICETWLDKNISNSEFEIKGYKTFRVDRSLDFYPEGTYTVEARGGVLLMIKDFLKPEVCENLQCNAEILWCNIFPSEQHCVTFGVVYRPERGKQHNLDIICESINRCENSDCVLVGDFNFRDIDWVNVSSPHELDSIFINTLTENAFTQLVEEPTRGTNILDLVVTTNSDLVENLVVSEHFSSSDHKSINFEICLPKPRINEEARKVYLYSKGDYEAFNSEILNQDWETRIKHKSVEGKWKVFKDTYSEMLEKHVPHKLIKPGQKLDPPWTRSKNVKRARRKRRNAWKNVKSRNLNSDKLLYEQVKQEYKSELNNAKAKYEKELVDSIPENPKRFYNYTRSFSRSSSTVEQFEVNGEKVYDDRGKADCLNSFFSSVLTEESPLRQTLPIKTDRCEKSTRFSPFTEEQVRNKLLKLKPNKSCGSDGIHVNVLRSVPALAVPLCDIFNHSVFSGYVPQDWRDGNITPLHKKGPRKLCSNYRPVTLTSQIVKLLERLVQDQLLAHVQENNIISCDQHGFQQKCSCVSQLLECMNDWTQTYDLGESTDVIYLDFAKAFDTVAHQRLLAKLDHCGIRGHLLTWISSFLSGRRQRVVLRNGISDWIPVTSGVPQGSILGPLLFLVFVSDLPNIALSMAKLFADDTKLYRQIMNIMDCDILQDDLNEFSAWSKIWLIKFNAIKCIVLRIREAIKYIYTLDGVNLESVDCQKDLGVTISKSLKPATHIDIITKKAYQKIGMIKRCFTNFTERKVTTLYQAIIRPALEYASPVWNPCPGGGGGGGHSLVSSVPMRDQRIVEHTLNSVIDI